MGRATELVQLEQLIGQAAAGEPAFVLIGGESGVGKSRLLEEFAAAAARSGARVITGDCVDLGDAELPYAPLVGALRGVAADELGRLLPRGATELSTLLPQLQAEAGELAPASFTQARLFELLLALLGGLGTDEPLVLLIEDAHWADPSTRDFLSFLIANSRSERLLVAVSYRTDELHRRHPLRTFLAEADRTRAVVRITLERFTKAELAQQLDGILGHPPPPELVEELFRRAEGNAFFSEELLAVGGGSAQVRLPDDVRDALMLRIEALGTDAQATLRIAAAAGARVRHALLEQSAAELQRDALLGGLRDAVAHHILVQEHDSDVYRFRHALLREALLDDLLPGERGPLHASIGRALASDPSLSASGRSVASELAAHWFAAHDLPAAFAASAQAGAEAEGMAAYAEANRHFERAAELWDAVTPEQRAGGPDRVELLRRAAEAIHVAGDGDRALALCRRALDLVDESAQPMLAANLHERIGRYLWTAGAHDAAADELRVATSTMPDDAPAVDRARILGAEGHILMLIGHDEARARCEQALALAREAGSLIDECRILNSLGPTLQWSGESERGIAVLQEARRIAGQLNHPEELMRSFINLAEILDEGGRLQDATQVARESVAVARREGFAVMMPLLISEVAQRLIRLSEWDEAAAILAEATAPARTWEIGRFSAFVALAYLQAARGDREGFTRSLRELEGPMVSVRGAMWTAPVAHARAEAALWLGNAAEAREVVRSELNRYERIVDADFMTVAPMLVAAARAEAELAIDARTVGDDAALAQIITRADEIRALAQRMIDVDSQPEAVLNGQTALVEVARANAAASAEQWRELAERWSARSNGFLASYCRWRAAELVLAGGGPRGDVQEMLDTAYRAAARLRAVPLQREISDLARRARLPLSDLDASAEEGRDLAATSDPAGDTAAERVGLTARELDVLRLMAGGATNREIAASLFISQKTVTVHITRILAKLDARTRVEAAGVAQRLGLLAEDPAA